MNTQCVQPLFLLRGLGGWGGVVNPTTKFSNRGLVDRTSSFKGGLLGKRVTFFRGVAVFT